MPLKTSKPTHAQRREVAEMRFAFVVEVGKCEICGSRDLEALSAHEVVRCGLRKFVNTIKSLMLVVCPICHHERIEKEAWPISQQVAYILRSRQHDFDLDVVNRWATGRVSQDDVVFWLDRIEERKPEFDFWA